MAVPKRDLITSAQLAFEQGRLTISKGLHDATVQANELVAYRVKISPTGHETYENSARETLHDDLVLALRLASLMADDRSWHYDPNDSPVVMDEEGRRCAPVELSDLVSAIPPTTP